MRTQQSWSVTKRTRRMAREARERETDIRERRSTDAWDRTTAIMDFGTVSWRIPTTEAQGKNVFTQTFEDETCVIVITRHAKTR